jgi:hypothetical protein
MHECLMRPATRNAIPEWDRKTPQANPLDSPARRAIPEWDRKTPQANPLDSPASGDSQLWLPDPNRVLRAALFAILGAMLVSGLGSWLMGVDLLEFFDWLPGCAFRAWTGFPCPGCGMGHALLHLSRLEWVAAVGANPAAPFLAVAMLAGAFQQAPDRAVCGMNPILAALCLAIVLATWLWRILLMAGASVPGL